MVQGIVSFKGGLEVNELSSTDDAIAFLSDTIFFGRSIFNSDTGGFALIYEGEKEVSVTFEKEYLQMPVVNITMKISSASDSSDYFEKMYSTPVLYFVDQNSKQGFSITLAEPAPADIEFGWLAIAVKDPRTFFSIKQVEISKPPVLIQSTLTPQPSSGVTAGETETVISGAASGSSNIQTETISPPSPTSSPSESLSPPPLESPLLFESPEPSIIPSPQPEADPSLTESPAPFAIPESTTIPEPTPELTPEPQPEPSLSPAETPFLTPEPTLEPTPGLIPAVENA